ncbi:hypothetical protein KC338_g2703 [Hortaea werneckii]|nr:hypothetical protein KC338_g2703 [Hortaea werneckii]
MRRYFLICCLAWLSTSTAAQDTLQSQNSTWNSTLTLTDAQIRAANLSAETVQNVEVAVNYERTNQPGGSIEYDDFYNLPDDYDYANPPKPGSIIKIEEHTNTTFYTLPPTVSMSRILYASETLNGSSFQPRPTSYGLTSRALSLTLLPPPKTATIIVQTPLSNRPTLSTQS